MQFMLINGASSIDLFAVCQKEEELNENGKTIINVFLHLTEVPVDDDHQGAFFPAPSYAVIEFEDAEDAEVNVVPPAGADIEATRGLIEEDGTIMTAFRITRVTFRSTGN